MTARNQLTPTLELSTAVDGIADEAFACNYSKKSAIDPVIIVMAVRCLSLYRGVACCASARLSDAAKPIARALLEQYFYLVAIARAPTKAEQRERWKRIDAQHKYERTKSLRKLKSLPVNSRGSKVTDGTIDAALASVGSGAVRLAIADVARWAGLSDMYVTWYATLSAHVHPSLSAVSKMVKVSADGYVVSAMPDVIDLCGTLVASSSVMLDVLRCLPDGFVSAERLKSVEVLEAKVVLRFASISKTKAQ